MDDRSKMYRAWDAQQGSQQSVSPQDVLPEDDLVFFLLDVIPQLDLSASTSITHMSCVASRPST